MCLYPLSDVNRYANTNNDAYKRKLLRNSLMEIQGLKYFLNDDHNNYSGKWYTILQTSFLLCVIHATS